MSRAWDQLAGYLAAAALFGFVSFCAFQGGHALVAVVLALMAAGLAALAFRARRAECPRCGRGLTFTDYAWCPRCLEYYSSTGAALEPVPETTVAEAPRFVAQFKRLKVPEQWAWPEPGRCSVCGAPATRSLRVTLNASLDGIPWPSLGDVRPAATIEHCDVHSEGVSVGSEPGEEEHPRSGVSFRSYRLWRLFQELNRRAPDE
jgi:hypothetical protein